ncbi:MAG: hypothetical protein QOC92_1529 [Acidimicrobiaceae bacterium]|jgi:hypothetical protein
MHSAVAALITTVALATASGCAGDESPLAMPGPHATPTSLRASSVSAPAAGCPPVITPKGGGFASVDYVDFVQSYGRNYITGLIRVPPIANSDLGPRVLTVRCSFSELNSRTGHMTPPPRDGDAAFLPAGTPVYSIRGWSPSCRLAGREHGELHVFLAYRQGGTVATPESCALRHGR